MQDNVLDAHEDVEGRDRFGDRANKELRQEEPSTQAEGGADRTKEDRFPQKKSPNLGPGYT